LKSSLSGSLSQSPAADPPPLLPPELLSAPMVFCTSPSRPPTTRPCLCRPLQSASPFTSHFPAPNRRQNRHRHCPPSQAGLFAT
jgi:hypothetical protein